MKLTTTPVSMIQIRIFNLIFSDVSGKWKLFNCFQSWLRELLQKRIWRSTLKIEEEQKSSSEDNKRLKIEFKIDLIIVLNSNAINARRMMKKIFSCGRWMSNDILNCVYSLDVIYLILSAVSRASDCIMAHILVYGGASKVYMEAQQI